MSSDISRQRFNPKNNFSGVLMQQGRVQLDADWNEWNEILDRRWRSETIDIIGRGVVPLETPNGFGIQLSGGALTIGRGRIYVDGLQAENHGGGATEFDPVLGETRGVDPVPYDEQPYFPNPTPLPEARGPHLVYLDVWEREVTAIEDPGLREVALGGPDTTTRLQTVWQVRVLPNVGRSATCSTPDGQLEGWLDIIQPSGGRLTTAAAGVATENNPCLVPPSGGYRGLDNRTYRVEIHDAGAAGGASFKWSRDNASVASNISRIDGGATLTVDRAVWDSVRRFSPGQWVELTDDWRELSGAPGEIRRIATVLDASRTITLDEPLTAGLFPVNGQNLTDPARRTRIKRWDQSGLVRDSMGATFIDLDAPGSTGLIPIPPAGTSLILEDGVQVTFTVAGGGEFRAGDYWVFAARTADASVEILDEAPPRGVHHHYCRLAVVTFPNAVTDCRVFWPPPFGGEGESCDCTLCVTAEEHNQGTFTIHQAVNQLRQSGGTICLGPGVYNLAQTPVQLEGAFAVRIRGQGAATVIIQPLADAAFIFRQAQWCTLDYLTIRTIAGTIQAPAIRLRNSVGTTIERLLIGPPAEGTGPLAGVLLEPGFLLLTRIRGNLIRARFGVAFAPRGGPAQDGALLLGSFYCEENSLQCSDSGVALGGSSYYFSDTIIARNLVTTNTVAGIAITGLAFTELDLTGNTINPERGAGIIIGTSARVTDNEITNLEHNAGDGIRLVPGLLQLMLLTVIVSGNRLQGLRGNGISIETRIITGRIEHNVLNSIEGNGIIMSAESMAGTLSVSSNELINIASGTATATQTRELAAIHLRGVFEGAVSDNSINAVARNAALAAVIAGVRVDRSLDVRISDNSIINIAPDEFSHPAAGVLIIGPLIQIEIANNLVRRQLVPTNDRSPWEAVRILGVSAAGTPGRTFNAFSDLSPGGRINTVTAFAAAVRGTEQLGICGNALHGFGGAPVVEAEIAGTCRFSDNHCSASGLRLLAAVDLTAISIIASSNRVECNQNTRSLDLKVGGNTTLAVLGNLVGGPILVNNAALSGPWPPLNIHAP